MVIAGLDLDFKGRPFGPMPNLLATAEYVTKLHAICKRTGGPAHFSHRTVAGDQTFMLGETEAYEPVSRVVYNMLNKKGVGIQAHDIVASSGARLVGPSQTFLHFAFDSRRMNSSVPTCFISITTASNDGHEYIEQAISRGAVAVVCKDTQRWAAQYPGISFIEHSNPIEVLQQWASACRKSFEGPVLAITGSNGKTIVKEWMFQLLGAPENVHRTPGSFNSSIGVPLTLSALQQACSRYCGGGD